MRSHRSTHPAKTSSHTHDGSRRHALDAAQLVAVRGGFSHVDQDPDDNVFTQYMVDQDPADNIAGGG